MLRDLFTIAGKDLRILSKDRGALAVLFLMPLVFAMIFGGPAQFAEKATDNSGAPASLPEFGVIVANLDDGQYGEMLATAFSSIPVLDVTESEDVIRADQDVADGNVTALIIIPVGFTEMIDSGLPAEIRIVGDPTQDVAVDIIAGVVNEASAEVNLLGEIKYGIRAVMTQSGILEELSASQKRAAEAQTLGVIWTQVEAMRRDPIIATNVVYEDGESREPWHPFTYYAPSFGVMFAFFLIAFAASSLLKERESGVLSRIAASRVPIVSVILGKVTAYGAIVFLQIIMMFAISAAIFRMPFGNAPFALLLVTISLAVASTSLAMMVGALAKSSEQAGNIGTLLGFILMVVGGCIFPFFRQGGAIAIISYLTPHAHAIQAYMSIMSDGASLGDVYMHILALVAFATVFSLVAARRLKLT